MRIIGKKSQGVQTRSKFLIFVEDIANLAVSVKKTTSYCVRVVGHVGVSLKTLLRFRKFSSTI